MLDEGGGLLGGNTAGGVHMLEAGKAVGAGTDGIPHRTDSIGSHEVNLRAACLDDVVLRGCADRASLSEGHLGQAVVF